MKMYLYQKLNFLTYFNFTYNSRSLTDQSFNDVNMILAWFGHVMVTIGDANTCRWSPAKL